ncbi:hypothetical protein DFH07DRAFT_781234 [Mycena maculata]|uniref:Uncharacterized protein n=1 Tax=Mycena maculata TaxID=230809 RepID=A0AAD7HZ17_9AGAR|nr:hypothetical protein DFH07DRAFT_781234 [Mycena maculata]
MSTMLRLVERTREVKQESERRNRKRAVVWFQKVSASKPNTVFRSSSSGRNFGLEHYATRRKDMSNTTARRCALAARPMSIPPQKSQVHVLVRNAGIRHSEDADQGRVSSKYSTRTRVPIPSRSHARHGARSLHKAGVSAKAEVEYKTRVNRRVAPRIGTAQTSAPAVSARRRVSSLLRMAMLSPLTLDHTLVKDEHRSRDCARWSAGNARQRRVRERGALAIERNERELCPRSQSPQSSTPFGLTTRFVGARGRECVAHRDRWRHEVVGFATPGIGDDSEKHRLQRDLTNTTAPQRGNTGCRSGREIAVLGVGEDGEGDGDLRWQKVILQIYFFAHESLEPCKLQMKLGKFSS